LPRIISSSAAPVWEGVKENVKAVGRQAGIVPPMDRIGTNTVFQDFGYGVQDALLRGMLLDLAILVAAANGQTGRALSNEELTRFLRRIGAESKNPVRIMALVADTARIEQQKFIRRYEMSIQEKFPTKFNKVIGAGRIDPKEFILQMESDEGMIDTGIP